MTSPLSAMLGTMGMNLSPLAATILAVSLAGCGRSPQVPPESPPPLKEEQEPPQEKPPGSAALPPTLTWEEETFSPRPASPEEPELEELNLHCGHGDQALHEVAAWAARYQSETGQPAPPDDLRFHLRQRGAPYVMPRLWSVKAEGVPWEQLGRYVLDWASERPPLGTYRCGVGLVERDGVEFISAVQVDVLAELKPLPTLVSAGGFVDFHAELLVPGTAADVVLLPPEGRPFSVSPSLERGRVRARLSLPTSGTWLVQLMATVEGGPRPVAEALITAGQRRPERPAIQEVPGESAHDETLTPQEALFVMMNAARQGEGLPPLGRNARLDRLAQEHSERMRARGHVSHDTGHGDPEARISAVGLKLSAAGENVALAASVVRLHRVLWASPSHRENLLLRRWEEAGVGITRRDSDGTLFATQLFIDR